jgi:hypothetical protein
VRYDTTLARLFSQSLVGMVDPFVVLFLRTVFSPGSRVSQTLELHAQ